MFESVLAPVAASLGARTDQIQFIGLLLVNVPLSSIIPQLEEPWKHLYSIALSWFFLWPVLGLKWGYIQLLGQALVSFGVSKVASRAYARQQITWPWPWLVFATAMGHLLVIHVARYVSNASPDEIEVSQMMMVLIQRVTLFAWTSYDNALKQTSAKSKKPIVQEASLPLLTYLGYCFCLPVFLAGPGIDYKSYLERTSLPLPPGRSEAAFKKTLTGLVFVAIFAVFGPSFSYTKMLQDSFLSVTPFMRVVYVNLAGLLARTKYYGVWMLADAACVASGIGRTMPAVDGDVEPWSHASNVDIPTIEFAENWKMLLSSWNSWTNIWLRETIYIRVARADRKPGFKSTMTTFFVSALWHGVNVCYFMTFILGSLIQSLAKQMRRHVRPFFLPSAEAAANGAREQGPTAPTQSQDQQSKEAVLKFIYDVAGTVLTQCMLNYIVLPFVVLDVKQSLVAWGRVGWYGHILTFVPLLALHLGGKTALHNMAQSRAMPPPPPKTPRNERRDPLVVGDGDDVEEVLDPQAWQAAASKAKAKSKEL